MPRHISSIKDLGQAASWMLLQQARGIPEAKAIDDFLEDKTFVLMFTKVDLAERLCVTAAIRQMSGHAVYFSPEEDWEQAIDRFPMPMLGAVSYYMDGVFVNGLTTDKFVPHPEISFPYINCGGEDAHPAHAIADLACMLRQCKDDLRGVKVCWLGSPSGTLFSLISASKFFPFNLSVAIPESVPQERVRKHASENGLNVTFYDNPIDAVRNARFIMGGSSRMMDFTTLSRWQFSLNLMSFAAPDAYIMLGVNPVNAIPLDTSILEGRHSLILMQAENRLRVYKRMLHWVFEE